MAEDRVLFFSPFRGTHDEDPAEFWRRLEVYRAYKNIAPPDQLRLVIAMLVKNAQDWVKKLDGDQKNSISHLNVAFIQRFIKPPALRFRSACEMFGKKQADNESVDAYANRLRSLAKSVDIDDATLLYAFVSGLRGKLASFVLGKNPANIESAINNARVAKMSLKKAAGSDTGFLSQQITEMRRDLQKLAQRYDSIAISAPVQSKRPKPPTPRVTFQKPPAEVGRGKGYAVLQALRGGSPGGFGRSRGRGRASRDYQVLQAMRGGGRGYFRRNARGGFQQNYPSQQKTTQPGQYCDPSQSARYGAMGEPKCGKCGNNRHSNVLYCPANNQQCLHCGRVGRYKRYCRLVRSD